ncbi:MAG: hypothetical protein ABIU11_02895 [Chitinophagaceae bacterium]
MTRFIFISILSLAMVSMTTFTASAGTRKSSSVSVNDTKETDYNSSSSPVTTGKAVPVVPAAKPLPPLHQEEKSHAPKLEELPHIHYFHKERVKKIKRHHKKCWTLSMVLLVLCHIAILTMSYIHVTPH